jgi:NTE family protein
MLFTKAKQAKSRFGLSGSGAKGFAHIGVLKVLKSRVKIDYIGGTSMGAVVGGFMPQDIMLLKSILFFGYQL